MEIDDEMLNTENVLSKQTEKNSKYEKEMTGDLAMRLATKDALLERGEEAMWKNRNWTKLVGKTMVSVHAFI